jgi:hypothetical protein
MTGCPECERRAEELPPWLRPEYWACGAVCTFLFICSLGVLWAAYTGMGFVGFCIFGLVLYALPGYLLFESVSGQVITARMKANARPRGRPKWTQKLRSVPTDKPDQAGDTAEMPQAPPDRA